MLHNERLPLDYLRRWPVLVRRATTSATTSATEEGSEEPSKTIHERRMQLLDRLEAG